MRKPSNKILLALDSLRSALKDGHSYKEAHAIVCGGFKLSDDEAQRLTTEYQNAQKV